MSEPTPTTDALEQRGRMLRKALHLLEAQRGDLAAEELGRALTQFADQVLHVQAQLAAQVRHHAGRLSHDGERQRGRGQLRRERGA